jgi:branched-chain amino acid transport system permease protein
MTNRFLIPAQWCCLLALAITLALIPVLLPNDYFLFLFNVMALNGLVVLGLNLLIGSTGQVSLGHAAFFGMGAYLSAIASTTWGWPLPVALAVALVGVGIASLLLAVPTLRLEGHYLVMATLGFNIIVTILLNQLEPLTGGPSGFTGIPQIALGGRVIDTDREFYFFIWSVVLAGLLLALNLVDSRIGRALRAIHEKELTAQTLGIPTHRYKVATFVISALYAALAGFCYAHYVTFISPKTFDIFYSVQIVTMLVVGGMGSLWGGLFGTALLTALPEVLHRFEDLHVLIYGMILMGVLVFSPQGLVPAAGAAAETLRRKLGRQGGAASAAVDDEEGEFRPRPFPSSPGEGPGLVPRKSEHPSPNLADPNPILDLQTLSVSFGGLQALTEVSLTLPSAEIVGLIGPNGAGKTTLLNVVSGLIHPDAGQVLLGGQDLTGRPPYAITACGIGRTFQTVQVYRKMTVLENLLLGFHTRGRSGFVASCWHSPRERSEEAGLRSEAATLLDDFGLSRKLGMAAERLSLVEQKLLEMARALALAPRVLLLDEPAGGLNPREREMLVDCIGVLRDSGMAIVLVEHDMNVVMRLADRVAVLQHGSLIATAPPREIQKDPRVIAAYLGTRH